MSRPLLPPRGIFVPTHMIFNPQIPPAVLVTWIQLRCLAWDGWVTPPRSISELASLIAIHPARLNRHLSQLQDISALVCRTSVHGKIIVTFPEEPTVTMESHPESLAPAGSTFFSPENLNSLDPPSYFPAQILGYLSIQADQDRFPNNAMQTKDLIDVEVEEDRLCEEEINYLDG